MKTAPFDREPPFVLLPTKRETLWRRLINRLRSGLGKSKRDIVDGELKGLDALQAGPKMSGGNDFLSSLAASNTHNRAGNNFNNSYSTLNAVGGNNVEVNNWRAGVSGDLNRLAAHKTILIFETKAGEGYAMDGSKWSRNS